MLQTLEPTKTVAETPPTPNNIKSPSRVSNTSTTTEEKSQRRRSTFYVPLVIQDSTSDGTCIINAQATDVTNPSNNQNYKGTEITKTSKSSTTTTNSIVQTAALETTSKSLKSSSKMTPPCGLTWNISKNNSSSSPECYASDDEMFLAIPQQQSRKKAVQKLYNKKQISINNKNKRYGVVLYGNNSDDDMQQNNNNTGQQLDVIANKQTLSSTSDEVTNETSVYEDVDSEISRVQTNTSTPIKMMKSRSRTNILSVPPPIGSCNLQERQAPLLMKSKTMPQNLTPAMFYEMSGSKSNLGLSKNVNESTSQVIKTANISEFPSKNLISSKLSSSSKNLNNNKTQLTMNLAKNSKNSNTNYTTQQSQQKTASPAKKSLSFIRRAHSTKLPRSNSLLKSQQEQQNNNDSNNMLQLLCYSGGLSKNLYASYEVQTLHSDELSMYLRSDHGAHLIRERFNLNITQNNDCNIQQSLERCEPSTSTFADYRCCEHIDDQNQQDDAGHHSDTSYEKACRRGSAPATPILGQKQNQCENTTSKFTNFFSKRANPLKRTKSVTKLERTKRGSGGLRGSRSHESLLSSHAVMSTIDLSCTGAVGVAAVHQSVLGRRYCFQIRGGPRGERYYSCSSRQERDLWIYSLRKSIAPNADQVRHIDNSLKMWIYEAKNLPPKKKYFCEILLDNTLYGRTSIKPQTDLLFWGEYFDFPDIPDINIITINLFREGEKKKKRDKHTFVGSVKIPIHEVRSFPFTESWYEIFSEKHSDSLSRSGHKDIKPTLRIKCRFQSTDILPLHVYMAFLSYLKDNYKQLCEILEPVISVKAKEDIGQALVLLMHAQGMASSFLTDVVALDLLRVGDQRLTFRGNSLATKSMEAFLKLTGEQYLQDTLSLPITQIIQSDRDCEVDPSKSSTSSLQRQQATLLSVVRNVWQHIYESHKHFPHELRVCFATFRERLEQLGRQDMADNLISASIFLRFLCPAILSPSLFNITNELPSARATRNLTLVAKTLQTLANFTRFQGKENFMEFLNDFLEQEAPRMKEFLNYISQRSTNSEPNTETVLDWPGYIDQAKQLSILHTLFSECLPKLPDSRQKELDVLRNILEDINKAHTRNEFNKNISFENEENYQTYGDDFMSNSLKQQSQSNQIQMAEPQHAVVMKPISTERGIIRGVLTPNSLEKNIFRYNDPTVSGLLQQHQRHSNSQNSIPNSGSQYNLKCVTHSQSQNSINSEKMSQQHTQQQQHQCSTAANKQQHQQQQQQQQQHQSTTNLSMNSNESEILSIRAATLPRGNNNSTYDELNGDFIQISGLDTNSAFVRKSPTPNLKSNNYLSQQQQHHHHHQQQQQQHQQQPHYLQHGKLNLGIPAKQTAAYQRVYHDLNTAANMPKSIEELDDLFKYAEEHAVVEHYNKTNNRNKQENDKIKQDLLSGVAHANSPVEQYKMVSGGSGAPLAFKNPTYQLQQSQQYQQYESPYAQQKQHQHNPQRNVVLNSVGNHMLPSANHQRIRALGAGTGIVAARARVLKSEDNAKNGITPTSSEERLWADKYVGERNLDTREHIIAQRSISGGSNSSSSGQVANRTTGIVNGNYATKTNIYDRVTVSGGVEVQPLSVTRYQRRLSLDSARTLSDSSTDAESPGHNGNGRVHVNDGKRRRQLRCINHNNIDNSNNKSNTSANYDQNGEIQLLQETLDTLRHTLDRDEAELRDSSDELFALQRCKHAVSATAGAGGIVSQNINLQSESTMRSIIDRLITMEEELRREQLKMTIALSHKQRVIEEQGQQIAALDAANSRLLNALTALRQRYENQQQQQQQQQQKQDTGTSHQQE